MSYTKFVLSILLCITPAVSYAELININCSGEGPSLALARMHALKDCSSSAATRINSSFKFKSLTVQTDQDSSLHDEIASDQEITGLNCLNQKEEAEERSSSFFVKIKCDYDTSKAQFTNRQEVSEESLNVESRSIFTGTKNLIDVEAGFAVTLAIIPGCDSILIESVTRPQIIRCKTNPVRLVLKKTDQNVIVRYKKYKPKTLDVNSLRSKHGTTQVILDF